MPKPNTLPIGLLLLAAMAQPASAAPLSGNIAIHDPTIAVLEDGLVSFATGVERAPDGGQIRTKTSPTVLTGRKPAPCPAACPTGSSPNWA